MTNEQVYDEAEHFIIPFGKWKGYPLAHLLTDPTYVAWLQMQPGLLDKHPVMKKFILKGFATPEETPTHNRLQTKFLDRQYVLASLGLLLTPGPADCLFNWERHVAKTRQKYATADEGKPLRWEETRSYGATFESPEGWDVVAGARLALRGEIKAREHEGQYSYDKRSRGKNVSTFVEARAQFELKPTLADEYPRVLREIKYRQRQMPGFMTALVIESFSAEGATLAQVRDIFGRDEIRVVTDSEILAVMPQVHLWELPPQGKQQMPEVQGETKQ